MLPIAINFLLAIHVLVSALLVFIVLLQRPRSEGLGSAFGGGVTENMFGVGTSNVLAKFTVWLGGSFFAITLLLSMLYSMRGKDNEAAAVLKALESQPAPIVATPAPGETPATEGAPAPGTQPEAATVEPNSSPAAEASPAPAEQPTPSDAAAPTPAPEAASVATPAPAESAAPAVEVETSQPTPSPEAAPASTSGNEAP